MRGSTGPQLHWQVRQGAVRVAPFIDIPVVHRDVVVFSIQTQDRMGVDVDVYPYEQGIDVYLTPSHWGGDATPHTRIRITGMSHPETWHAVAEVTRHSVIVGLYRREGNASAAIPTLA